MSDRPTQTWLDQRTLRRAVWESVLKLSPQHQLRNPVMFTVLVGSVFTTGLAVQALFGRGEADPGFIVAIAAWLWFTLLFANFAEAIAAGAARS
jgi:K+-transporting ATPase ATPase B chain